uniref:OmpA/MotB domain protein n=1 Tax=Psychrobacter sp. (strain PRwf-1) TaxID=349106 RepID=A5WGW6_PSYWF
MKFSSLISVAILNISLLSLLGCQTVLTSTDSPKQIVTTAIEASQLDSDEDGVPDINDECPNTPQNMVVDPNGCPASLLPKEGSVRAEFRAFYDTNSSEIKSKYREELDRWAKKMDEYPDAYMLIEAHISEPEARLEENASHQTLALSRVEGIKNYLIQKHNIDPNRIRTYTYSAERPIAPNDDAEGIKLNQRVYAVIDNADYFINDILKIEND